MKQTLLSLLLIIISFTSFCQESKPSKTPKKREVVLGIGGSRYNGDLGNGYGSSSLLFTVGLKLNREKRLHGNVSLTLGSVSGHELGYQYDEEPSATPNTSFSTSLVGLNYDPQYYIIDWEKFKLYFSQGIGFVRYQPRDESDNNLLDQSETRPEGETYGNLALMLPTQFGVRYYIKTKYSVGLQFGWLNTMTDYLDNLNNWGNRDGNDNVFTSKVVLSFPIN